MAADIIRRNPRHNLRLNNQRSNFHSNHLPGRLDSIPYSGADFIHL